MAVVTGQRPSSVNSDLGAAESGTMQSCVIVNREMQVAKSMATLSTSKFDAVSTLRNARGDR